MPHPFVTPFGCGRFHLFLFCAGRGLSLSFSGKGRPAGPARPLKTGLPLEIEQIGKNRFHLKFFDGLEIIIHFVPTFGQPGDESIEILLPEFVNQFKDAVVAVAKKFRARWYEPDIPINKLIN